MEFSLCKLCSNVFPSDDILNHPKEFFTLVCRACHDKIEDENNRGSETDSFGNIVEWHACPDDGLISFSVNSVEVADWSYEDDPEDALHHFMQIWNKAQSLTNNANIEALTAERDQLALQVEELKALHVDAIGDGFFDGYNQAINDLKVLDHDIYSYKEADILRLSEKYESEHRYAKSIADISTKAICYFKDELLVATSVIFRPHIEGVYAVVIERMQASKDAD